MALSLCTCQCIRPALNTPNASENRAGMYRDWRSTLVNPLVGLEVLSNVASDFHSLYWKSVSQNATTKEAHRFLSWSVIIGEPLSQFLDLGFHMGNKKLTSRTTPRKGILVECVYCKQQRWLSFVEASSLNDMPDCDDKKCGGFCVAVKAAT